MAAGQGGSAILSDAMGAAETKLVRGGEQASVPPNHESSDGLERGLGLKVAVALNMIEIVGIGPFVVSGIVIQQMGGPQALLAWLAGAAPAALVPFVISGLCRSVP